MPKQETGGVENTPEKENPEIDATQEALEKMAKDMENNIPKLEEKPPKRNEVSGKMRRLERNDFIHGRGKR